MLSDQVFHFFGRTITITGNELFLAIAVLAIAFSVWAVQQFRRRRSIVVQRSAVSDQMLYELSRIADTLDRIASRPIDQAISSGSFKTDESRSIPFSMFGRER